MGKYKKGLQFTCDICSKTVTTRKSLKHHKINIHDHAWLGVICGICGLKLYSKTVLRDHIAVVHTKEEPYSCTQCPQKFNSSSNMSHHTRAHRLGNIINGVAHCRLCSATFTSSTGIIRHMMKHSGKKKPPPPRNFKCTYCHKLFPDKTAVRLHSHIHSVERPYSCSQPDCGKTFTQPGHRNAHFKTHGDIELGTLFPCPICSKVCRSRKILSNHQSYVHRKAPHSQPKQCYFCSGMSSTESSLRSHMLLHTKESPYSCYFCGKRVKTSGAISLHLGVHLKEKPHYCEGCKSWYRYQHTVRRHRKLPKVCGAVKEVKTMKKNLGGKIQCKLCHKYLQNLSSLEIHTRIHTGERPYRCGYSECDKSYQKQTVLKRHEHTHRDAELGTMFPCPICPVVLTSRSKLYHHKSDKHYNPFHLQSKECYFCGKMCCNSSALVTHLRVHTQENPYNCGGCGGWYREAATILEHTRYPRKCIKPMNNT